ncbi:carotenoid biosynthesis protein [Methylocystis heyeri]|uniref:Carotenoid biosynthesis protein n=1 Tax=Methylocystis heyeri TaxID=391905 RepID=A0A6B8KBZ7_9HYPH|nr:carotenoid biosynthesis protein [Methylocystis heyeri]QGM44581.1 carotenoid biosynthesis protein [Methylocystis heyeri]
MMLQGRCYLSSHWREAIIWSLIAVYLALGALYAWDPSPFTLWWAAIGCACAFIHCVRNYRFGNALALLAICLVVSFTTENIGSATGLIFGRYHFEVGAALPHVGAISIIVGGVWFGMGYFAWIVASTILDNADRRLNENGNIVLLPIVAALVMTQWDFVMDAPMATISKAWIWHEGGAVFGAPLTNYFGWLLTSWLFYQGFAFYLASRRSIPVPTRESAYRLVAILFYAFSGLTHLTPWLIDQSGDVADATGYVWRVHDIREATVAAMLFTMFFTSIIAAARLARTYKKPSTQII